MSDELIFYCNAPILYGKDPVFKDIPGIDNYKKFARLFDINSSPYDRSNTITVPFKVKSTPIPSFEKHFKLSYRDCAYLSMQNLDNIHKQTGKKFRLLYSGGVDSSGIFSAFVDYYGLDKTKNLLEICCSKDSITENPWLWDRYIRKHNFDIISSHDHSTHWNDNKIILMGEINDHLFGKRVDYNYYLANKTKEADLTENDIEKYLNSKAAYDPQLVRILFDLIKSAPFSIKNMFTFLWWINFVLTWEGITHRVLSHANILPADTMHSGLIQFYNTPEFQKWSMSYHCNYDISLPPLYRVPCKEMTLDILDIPEYKDKHKFLSFPKLHAVRPSAVLIDTDLNLYRNNTDYLKFVALNNSFI
jgi:hypothetical protein